MIKYFKATALIFSLIGILVAVRTYAIMNGDPVLDPEDSSEVFVCSPFICGGSGTMLTNDWVLTAAHVIPNTDIDPGGYFIYPGGYQVGKPIKADFAVRHPSLDFALLHLEQGVALNNNRTEFKRGIYTNSTLNLSNRALTLLGYGIFNKQGDYGVLHKAAVTSTGNFDAYNFEVAYQAGQSSGSGDSGGGAFTTGPAPSVIAGVNKNGSFGRPENFRDWALSYIYNKPIPLPDAWFIFDSQYPPLWDRPLQNNFTNRVSWNPCPQDTYTWKAEYSLEPNKDFITITTNPVYTNAKGQPLLASGVTTTLNGWNGSASGVGEGYITITVKTNEKINSPGLLSLPIQCSTGIRFSNPWPKPLPAGTSVITQSCVKVPVVNIVSETTTSSPMGTSTPMVTSTPPKMATSTLVCTSNTSVTMASGTTTWSPCPGGASYQINYAFDFRGDDQGTLSFDGGKLTPTELVLRGVAKATTTVTTGPVTVGFKTGVLGQSPGFTALTAICSAAIQCHGPTCFTTPDPLPNDIFLERTWTPCNGKNFAWYATYDMQKKVDSIEISDSKGITRLTGSGSIGPIPSEGTVGIRLDTTPKVPKIWFPFTPKNKVGAGLKDLHAVCSDW